MAQDPVRCWVAGVQLTFAAVQVRTQLERHRRAVTTSAIVQQIGAGKSRVGELEEAIRKDVARAQGALEVTKRCLSGSERVTGDLEDLELALDRLGFGDYTVEPMALVDPLVRAELTYEEFLRRPPGRPGLLRRAFG